MSKYFVLVRDNSNPLAISWRDSEITGITCSTKPGDFRVNFYFADAPSITVEFFRKDSDEVQRLLDLLTSSSKPSGYDPSSTVSFGIGTSVVEITFK